MLSPQALTHRRGITALVVAATAALLLAYAPPWTGLARDSGAFAYMGRALLHGAVPYRDFWDHKPPGVYLIDAVALSIGGDGPWSLWAASMLAAVGAAALAFVVLSAAFGPQWGLLGGTVHALLLVDPRLYEGGNLTEIYALGLQWAALWWLGRTRTAAPRALFLAGLAAGAAATLKPTTAAIACAAVLHLLTAHSSARRRVTDTASFIAGVVLLPCAVVLWLAHTGALAAAYDCVVLYNRAYARPDLLASLLKALNQCVSREPINVIGVLALASLLARAPSSESRWHSLARVTLLALPFEVLCLALPGRPFGHYFVTPLPVLTVRSVVLLSALAERFRAVRTRRRAWAAVLVVALIVRLTIHMWQELREASPRQARQARVVAEIQRRTTASDAVLVWGADLAVNVLVARHTPSVYGYAYPLFMPRYTTEAMWRRFLSDLDRTPPAVILDAAGADIPPLAAIVSAPRHEIPPTAQEDLRRFLRSYRREAPAGLDLWIRQPAP